MNRGEKLRDKKIPPLNELNKICQKPKYKEVGNWMVRNITRDMALPVTRLLLHTQINADQVVFLSLIIAFLSFLCLASLNPMIFLLGAVLLQVWYLFDHVDGQVARYRKEADTTGVFFDYLSHYLVHIPLFFFLGLRLMFKYPSLEVLTLMFTTAFSMGLISLIYDAKYKAYYARLFKIKGIKHKKQKVGRKSGPEKPSAAKRVFMFLYKLTEIHVVMNLLGAVAILDFFSPVDLPAYFFLFYALLLPFVFIARLINILKRNKIDSDFEAEFEVIK